MQNKNVQQKSAVTEHSVKRNLQLLPPQLVLDSHAFFICKLDQTIVD